MKNYIETPVLSTITCDVCKIVVCPDKHYGPPLGWASVTKTYGVPIGGMAKSFDLCPKCSHSYLNFLPII